MKMHLVTCNDFYALAISEKDKRLDENTVNKIKNILCVDTELSISDRIDLISDFKLHVIIIYSYDEGFKYLDISTDSLIYSIVHERRHDVIWILRDIIDAVMDKFMTNDTDRTTINRDELAKFILKNIKELYNNLLFVY